MKERLLLALLLSFLVLSIWQRLFPSPGVQKQVQNAEISVTSPSSVLAPSQELTEPSQIARPLLPVKPAVKETIEKVETDKFRLEFSNIGGNLKNIYLKEHASNLPVSKIMNIAEFDQANFKLDRINSEEVVYSLKVGEAQLIKTYRFNSDSYVIETGMQQIGHFPMSSLDIEGLRLDISRLDIKVSQGRDLSLYEYSVDTKEENTKAFRKWNFFKFKKNNGNVDYYFGNKIEKSGAEPVKWIGLRNRYYCAVYKPEYSTKLFNVQSEGSQLVMSTVIEANQNIQGSYNASLYFGPQNPQIMREYNQGYEEIIRFFSMDLFNSLARGFSSLLYLMNKVVPNWGLCIILMGIVVSFALYPLTAMSTSSMKKMQSLQPQMTKIKEQYKNNPQRLNKEMMELYKEHKVNPLGGCLPMVLQMPIFISVYQVMWRSVYFKGASFLWIKDLSEPDRLFHLPFTLPILNTNDFNLLPLILMVLMALQQKVTSKNMAATDPNQITQQKMMMMFFPVFLGFIFYKFASGLALYFAVFYLLSTFNQWKKTRSAKVG